MKAIVLTALGFMRTSAMHVQGASETVGGSPWGPNDEIGRLNLMTEQTQLNVLSRIKSGKVYDLSVDYYVGMPSWFAIGDPRYQFWLTHTPHGTTVDDPMGVGQKINEKVSYTGDAVSMYTHMGTHIDALNHFGLNGKIWNGYEAEERFVEISWRERRSDAADRDPDRVNAQAASPSSSIFEERMLWRSNLTTP